MTNNTTQKEEQKAQPYLHFHVVNGMPGYLNDDDGTSIYFSFENAKDGLKELVDNVLTPCDIPEEEFTPKDRFDYTQQDLDAGIIYNEDQSYYAEIIPCEQKDCLVHGLRWNYLESDEITDIFGSEVLKELEAEIAKEENWKNEGVSK